MNDPLREHLAATLGAAYSLGDELHGGGMSRVFVAQDHSLDRQVVIKVLAPERAGTLSTERFRKEALMAASLQHPHIVPILAVGSVDEIPFLIMPFVDGLSLRARLEQRGPLPLRDAVRVLLDVARACGYAHERGIVHRDIKPDNILMSGDAAMITDFGVARAIAAGNRSRTDTRLTQEGFTVGSPRYMAPEQATGESDIDHRVDIYAFGILAFELLAGRPPFDSPSSAALLRAHLIEPPPDLRTVRPETPAPLAALVTHCLAKRRDDRPATAAALVAALEDPAIISSSRSRPIARVNTPGRRWVIAAAIALVSVAAASLWAVRKHVPGHPDSIAILPVIDRTSDSTSEWMATGLTDEVTAVLGRTAGLRVAARRSVERFRSDSASPEQIARRLGVATVLDATLTRSSDAKTFQLAAQLIDGNNGVVLWSASLRGTANDVLALQDSVVAGVLRALGRTPDTLTAGNGLENPAARRAGWEEYLRGRQELRRRGSAHLREAISHFAAALAADALLPQAYAGLADAWSLLPLYDANAGQRPIARALDAVDHALALDPRLPEARASRGHLLTATWQWPEAEVDLRAAIAGNGALVDAQQWLGELLLLTGRTAEAAQVLTQARALDPTSPVLVAIQGLALGADRQYDRAMDAINASLRLDETFSEGYLFGGVVQIYAAKPELAITLMERGLALTPNDPLMIGLLGQARGMKGDSVGARAALRSLDALPEGIPRQGARAHVLLGLRDTTAALAALDQAVTDREPLFAAEPLGTPAFGMIRNSARFAALLDKLGFNAAAVKAIRGGAGS